MYAVNKVTLLGFVGKDIELKHSTAGKPYARFSLATTEKSGDTEKTQWHNLVAFGKLAEVLGAHVGKGSRIYCEGKLAYDYYEKDGVKTLTTNIIVNDLLILTFKKDGNENTKEGYSQETAPEKGNEGDDLPF